MLQVPHSERLEFFKFAYAGSMFLEAMNTLNYMRDEEISGTHPLAFPLWTAVHALYGKSFKQNPPLRLDEIMIPPAMLSLHKNLLVARDRMFAHADVKDFALSDGTGVNAVALVAKGTSIQASFRYMGPTPRRRDEIIELVTLLGEKCQRHTERIVKKYSKRLRLKDGELLILNTAPAPDDLLVKWRMREGLDDHPVKPKSPRP